MSKSVSILGLNAWHGDASATLVIDGELVAAAEEERFRRVKHWAGFPSRAAAWCLQEAGLDARDLQWIAVNRDPRAGLWRKALHGLRKRLSPRFLLDRARNSLAVESAQVELARELGVPVTEMRARLARVEHHRAHLASSFFVSPYERAAVASIDGFGDFASCAWGHGDQNRMRIDGRVRFPHSLGLLYLTVTQHLGFHHYGDEYKVMGMAGYGQPRYLDAMRQLCRIDKRGAFELGLAYFRHHDEGVPMTWNGGAPELGCAASAALSELLGPARAPEDELEARHFDLAASLQAVYEEALFALLTALHEQTGESALCLSGGCAMNGLANGKILANTPFETLYVPPAPGDAGGAIGAALSVWCEQLGQARRFEMRDAYLGPSYDDGEVGATLAAASARLESEDFKVWRASDERELARWAAERIDSGEVLGWFQGRMEWGPRALGNRSILADPRRGDVRELLNLKIKLRERFRPFAPSVLREEVGHWFTQDGDVPFMLEIWDVAPDKRAQVPAITHVDGTGRLQTVEKSTNPRYHALIEAFRERTGVPMVLNTSFNENEPVVCRPEEALDCFLRTGMDALVLGDRIVERRRAA